MKKVATLLLISSISIAKFSYSQQVRKYSNEFLNIGVGARGLGLGNAQSAVVNDATAAYWNPAGLIAVKSDIQIALMHAEYFAGIAKYDYGTVAIPIDKTSVVAASLIRFGVDNIPDTSELIDSEGNINYDRIKSLAAADYSFMFSYARESKAREGLFYGANAKVIYRNVGEYANAWGFGIDLGIQYHSGSWKFGLVGRDISSTFNAWRFNQEKLQYLSKTGNEIPQNGLEITLPRVVGGLAYTKVFREKYSVMATADLDFTFDGKRNVPIKTDYVSVDPHGGVELGYNNFIFLRAGVGNIQQVKQLRGTSTSFQPNIGVGLKLNRLTLDYAYTNIGSQSETPYSNIFSLKLDIIKGQPFSLF